ncbi:MAG: hypothetical protein P8I80_01515 [Bacteroidales bacterium]|nr:hypothetical protein [Bacteroidales bacterium]
MKKIHLLVIVTLTLFVASCTNKSLNQEEVKDFVNVHFAERVNGAEAVEPFINDFNDSIYVMFANYPPRYWDPKSIDSTSFVEDSAVSEVYSVDIYGNNASVFGKASMYLDGVEIDDFQFHAIISKMKDKLYWKRFYWVNSNSIADNYMYPSTSSGEDSEGYWKMRDAMLNMRINEGVRLSDSLVVADPNWASAHLGQLHAYIVNDNVDGLNETLKIIEGKIGGASTAEKLTISAYNPSLTPQERQNILSKALAYANDDMMLMFWYGFTISDSDTQIEFYKKALKRYPISGPLNNIIGYAYMNNGNMDLAGKHFAIYLAFHSDEPNAYDSMGDYLAKLGDKDSAKNMYLMAAKMDSDFAKMSTAKAEAL